MKLTFEVSKISVNKFRLRIVDDKKLNLVDELDFYTFFSFGSCAITFPKYVY